MEAIQTMPVGSTINFRMLAFAGIVLFLLGWPAYTFVSTMVHHGVFDRGDYLEVDLKAIGFFEMNPRTATIDVVPPDYRPLDGKRVLLQGEIYQPQAAFGVMKDFTLVYSVTKCCWGGPPKVQESVLATVSKKAKVDYEGTGVYYNVMGTLHITMKRDPVTNDIVEVYHLDVEKVWPKT